jgi:hypothetical protein
MLKYEKFPPISKFEYVLKHIPESALLYVRFFHDCDLDNSVVIEKKITRNLYQCSLTVFRNHCFSLRDEGFIEISENTKYFYIDLNV